MAQRTIHVHSIAVALLALAALLLAGPVARASAAEGPELVVNGSFEDPSSGGYWTPTTGPPGWRANAGDVEQSSGGTADTGSLWLDLDGSPSTGSVYQDIATDPGHSYALSFAFARNPGCDSNEKDMAVKWNGTTIDTLHFTNGASTPSDMGWLHESYTVSGSTGATTRLEFVSLTGPSDCGPAVDSVSVKDQSPPNAAPSCAASVSCNWNLSADLLANITSATPTNPVPDNYSDGGVWSLRQGGSLDDALLEDLQPNFDGGSGVDAWTGDDSGFPYVAINTTGSTAFYSTVTAPSHKAIVHPAPKEPSVVVWRSPFDGQISVSGGVSDADGNGGDGIGWHIEQNGIWIAFGSYSNGGSQTFRNGTTEPGHNLSLIDVHRGDTLRFVVTADPAEGSTGDNSYDSTVLDPQIQETGNGVSQLSKPVIQNESVADVSRTSAMVQATINSEQSDTTWRVDWAPTSSGPWAAVPGPDTLNSTSAQNRVLRIPDPNGPQFKPDTTYYFHFVAINGAGTTTGVTRSVHTNKLPDIKPPVLDASATNLRGAWSALTPGVSIPDVDFGTNATITYRCTDPSTSSSSASGLNDCVLTDNGHTLPSDAGAPLHGAFTAIHTATLPTSNTGQHNVRLVSADKAGHNSVDQWTYTVKPKPTPKQDKQDATLTLKTIVKQFKPQWFDYIPNPPFPWGRKNKTFTDSSGREIATLWDGKDGDTGGITVPGGGTIVQITSSDSNKLQLYTKNKNGTINLKPIIDKADRLFEVEDAKGQETGIIAAGGGNIIGAGAGNIISEAGGGFTTAVIAGGGIISAGGGNVISAGGGNIIAAGAGNIIAAGGGNIIAAGAGNFAGGLIGSNFSSFRTFAPSSDSLGTIDMPLTGMPGASLGTKITFAQSGFHAASAKQVVFASGNVTFQHSGETTELGLKPNKKAAKLIKPIVKLNKKLRSKHRPLHSIKLTITTRFNPPGGKAFTIRRTIKVQPI